MSASIFPATQQNIERAVFCLKKGKAIAFPTETVYGLGANACDDEAVASIYALKSRPQFNPLISHMLDADMAKRYVEWNDIAEALAKKFWPGPLTLILPRKREPSPSGRGQGEGWATPKTSMDTQLKSRIHALRQGATDAEQLLWSVLRNRGLENYKFRRQHPVEPYIVDFCCLEAMLIIELDGGQHNTARHRIKDGKRSAYLQQKGFKVVRFWNNDVLQNLEGVVEVILQNISMSGHPHPTLSRGERAFSISLLASAGLDTVAVRSPAHPVARALIEGCGFPLAAPSANRSGRVSPTTAQHVAGEFGGAVEMILDGGACAVGIESTVVDCTGGGVVILRPGSVTKEEIAKALDLPLPAGEGRGEGLSKSNILPGGTSLTQPSPGGRGLSSPGMLESHYAPSLPVRLGVTKPEAGEALIAFGNKVPPGAKKILNLSEAGNLKEAAANLFATMRTLDSREFSAIAVMPIPDEGIGVAINDRLKRAALR